jgi:hypothetical protein
MNILSQYGHGDGNKTHEGLAAGFIKGVVFRPRDIGPDKLLAKCREFADEFPNAMLLFDPQLYAGILWTNENAHFGKLHEYRDYFGRVFPGRLEVEENVKQLIRKTVKFQATIPTSAIISPNIVIRRSFDSREAVIAKSFLRHAKTITREFEARKPVFATLAISRDALLNIDELQEFLGDITSLDEPPDGFYILVAANSVEARSDILNSQVISGWMLLNYSLKINDFKVVNAYSDLVSPLLGAIGADFGCTGWWSNSRTFSLEQFIASQSAGGSLPIQRYLSKALLNRIRFTELRAWLPFVGEILNNLDTDAIYSDEQEEPERAKEVLQSWQALSSLCEDFSARSVPLNLEHFGAMANRAVEYYNQLEGFAIRPEIKSNRDHLEPLIEAISLFRRNAEL